MDKINALFVIENGPYYGLDNVIPWSEKENAFNCKNGALAICHPPCKRWGRYWGGGPSPKRKFYLGDDDCCFAYSLWYVRTFGGIIEHPEGSHAYRYYGLNCPSWHKGWIKADNYGGYTCSVAQGNYGHPSRKMTWLYCNLQTLPELDWSIPRGLMRMDEGRRKTKRGDEGFIPAKRISAGQMESTPIPFRDLLISMVLNGNKVT